MLGRSSSQPDLLLLSQSTSLSGDINNARIRFLGSDEEIRAFTSESKGFKFPPFAALIVNIRRYIIDTVKTKHGNNISSARALHIAHLEKNILILESWLRCGRLPDLGCSKLLIAIVLKAKGEIDDRYKQDGSALGMLNWVLSKLYDNRAEVCSAYAGGSLTAIGVTEENQLTADDINEMFSALEKYEAWVGARGSQRADTGTAGPESSVSTHAFIRASLTSSGKSAPSLSSVPSVSSSMVVQSAADVMPSDSVCAPVASLANLVHPDTPVPVRPATPIPVRIATPAPAKTTKSGRNGGRHAVSTSNLSSNRPLKVECDVFLYPAHRSR